MDIKVGDVLVMKKFTRAAAATECWCSGAARISDCVAAAAVMYS